MMTKTLRKSLLATALIAAAGGFGMGTAMAHGAVAGVQASQGRDMGDKMSDAWITTKVKSEFATTKGVGFTDISVDTKAGVVVLTGTVGSDAEKELAKRTAAGVKGVRSVDASGLKVTASAD